MTAIDINEETLAFYFELGLTISQFTHLAHALHDVISFLYKDDEPTENFLRKFFEKDTFGAQLTIAKKFLPNRLPEELHEEWKNAETQLDRAKDNRNLLAHGWIITDTDAPVGERCMLVPGAAKYWKPGSTPHENSKRILDIVRIRYFNFHAGRRLDHILWVLRGKPRNEAEPIIKEPEEPNLISILKQPYNYLKTTRLGE